MTKFKRFIFILSAIVFTLCSVRLFEAIIKREIKSEYFILKQEYNNIRIKLDTIENRIGKKEGEKVFLSYQKSLVTQKEPYLRIQRTLKIAQLKLEDKTLREMRFQIKGRKSIEGEVALPLGVLITKTKVESTAFYIPDWIYELEAKEPPKDSLERTIKNAFGRYLIYLGGDIVISGIINEEVPVEALDLIHLEFENEDLEVIYNMLQQGASILFF